MAPDNEQAAASSKDRQVWWHEFICHTNSSEWLVGLFTFVLSIFTLLLVSATRTITDSAETMERAYISGGPGVKPFKLPNKNYQLGISINNFGKTPGTVVAVSAVVCLESELKDGPKYEKQFKAIVFDLQPNQRDVITGVTAEWCGQPGYVIYGRIWYNDILGKRHSYGFLLDILPKAKGVIRNKKSGWPLETNGRLEPRDFTVLDKPQHYPSEKRA